MTAHDTAPIILWRTALGGMVATDAPTTALDTYTSATGHEPPASDRDSDVDTPRQTADTTTVKFGRPDRRP
jgi:hypothetical protein